MHEKETEIHTKIRKKWLWNAMRESSNTLNPAQKYDFYKSFITCKSLLFGEIKKSSQSITTAGKFTETIWLISNIHNS